MGDGDTAPADLATARGRILELQLEVERHKAEAARQELAGLRQRRERRRVDPVLAGIVAALVGFLSNVVVTYLEGRNALGLEREKHESTKRLESAKQTAAEELERKQFQSSLILEAVKTGDVEEAQRNLEFFLDAGFLDDERVEDLVRSRKAPPVLPASSPAQRAPKPEVRGWEVGEIPEGARERALVDRGGWFQTGAMGSSALVVAPDLILVLHVDGPVEGATFRPARGGPRVGVVAEPVETGTVGRTADVSFALLRLEESLALQGPPLRVRAPEPDETLLLLHAPRGADPVLSRGSVRAPPAATARGEPTGGRATAHLLWHDCTTTAGSSGGPLFAQDDLALVGVHSQASPDPTLNGAVRMDALVRASATLREQLR